MIWTEAFVKELTTPELITAFEMIRDELNLKTITELSKSTGKVYNTAKKHKPFVFVGNTKFMVSRDSS